MPFTYSAGTLTPSTYQLGLGGSFASSGPIDLYTGVTQANAGTITPLTSTLVITAAGTVTTGVVQFPSNPVEGQRLRIMSTVAFTAVTLTAGTNATGASDTINGAVTSLAANTPVEYAYKLGPATNSASTAANLYTWYRVQ